LLTGWRMRNGRERLMARNASTIPAKNWFDIGGRAYALFRPEYPAGLSKFLAETVGGRGCAVDVGCGTGH